MALFCGQTPLAQMYLGASGPCGLSPVGIQLLQLLPQALSSMVRAPGVIPGLAVCDKGFRS